jgi:hypothetical protein
MQSSTPPLCIANRACGSRSRRRRGVEGPKRNAERSAPPSTIPPPRLPDGKSRIDMLACPQLSRPREPYVDVSSPARVCPWRAFTPFWWEGGGFVAPHLTRAGFFQSRLHTRFDYRLSDLFLYRVQPQCQPCRCSVSECFHSRFVQESFNNARLSSPCGRK